MDFLFDKKERTDPNPSSHMEGQYQFLDRCSISGLEEVRQTLNNWFNNYPSKERKELKQRFITEFSSAFFELFLHELFFQIGFDVVVHPDLPGTSKKPDFLVWKGGLEFYVEAREAKDLSDDNKSIKNNYNHFYDLLNQIDSPNFFLFIKELNIKSLALPSISKVKKHLEIEMNSRDPDVIKKNIESIGSIKNADSITYEDEKVKITIALIPRTMTRGETGLRAIGVYPIESTWGDTDGAIKSVIKKKATKYGELDKPYLICVNSTGLLTDDYSIQNALFGSLKLSISTNPENLDEKWFREKNGIFMGPKGPQFTRVSGVLITSVYVSNLHVVNYQIYKHPFAKRPINIENVGLSINYVLKNELKNVPGKRIQEILGIPTTWFENWNFEF